MNDLKLINAGKILENNKTLSECKSPICDFSGMTTMHVVVRAPTSGKQSGNFLPFARPCSFFLSHVLEYDLYSVC